MSEDTSPPLPVFAPHERVCGNCKLWSAHSVEDGRGWVGPCRLQPNRGMIPPSAPACDKLAFRGMPNPEPRPEVTRHRARTLRTVGPTIVRTTPGGAVVRTPPQAVSAPLRDPHEQIDLEGLTMTREELLELFREAAGDVNSAPLANKWEGGTIRLIPGSADAQSKDLPIDALLHKVVMIRDRLRTLEQKVNANPKLSDAEKVELQHYVTRCYGSLTTFNVLFKDKADQFVGQKGDD